MPGRSASKNIYCANSSSHPYTISLNWSEASVNTANNTSVITASTTMSGQYVSFAAGSSHSFYLKLYWHDDRTNSNTLFAQSAAFNTLGMSYGSRSASGSITVTHKADGTLNGYVWMQFIAPSNSGGWAPNSSDLATPNTALTTISSASDFTINAGNAQLGSPVTVNINRKSSSYTHRVSYRFGSSSSITVATSATTSVTFTPSTDLASYVSSTATGGTLTVSVTTWNGSTQIGNAINKSVYLSISSSSGGSGGGSGTPPEINSVTLTRIDNGIPSDWGVYVQGRSKVGISVSASAYDGASISSYNVSGPGFNLTGSNVTSPVLKTAGENAINCTVYDTRGASAAKTSYITVEPYAKPSVQVSANRCDSTGKVTANGTYLKVTVSWDLSVPNKNSVKSQSVTCNNVTVSTFGNDAPFIMAANLSIGNTYVLTATITDALDTSTTVNITVSTAERIMNIKKNKMGLAIGKFATLDSTFDVNWATRLRNSLTVEGDSTMAGVTATSLKSTGTLSVDGLTTLHGVTQMTGASWVATGQHAGPIKINNYVSSWPNTGTNSSIRNMKPSTSSSVSSLGSIATPNGSWQIGALQNMLYIYFLNKSGSVTAQYAFSNNSGNMQIYSSVNTLQNQVADLQRRVKALESNATTMANWYNRRTNGRFSVLWDGSLRFYIDDQNVRTI